MSSDTPQPTPQELADALVGILDVEPVELNFFRGIATPGGRGRSFGGHVIAPARHTTRSAVRYAVPISVTNGVT